jgi:uncharacterized protein YbjT (DUF2867 family)
VRVAVFGATGVVGRALVPLLVTGHDVVAISRGPEHSPRAGVEWVQADVGEPTSVAGALAGVDVVYYLVHSLGQTDFAQTDRRGAETVAQAAEQECVRQIVFLGGLGDDDPNASPHLRSRRETRESLAATSVPVTTVRAAMIVGRDSAAFETIRALVDRLPVMVCPSWVATPTQPIALSDVTRYLAGICALDEAIGETFDAGGPEVMSYREMMERIARLRGRRPLLLEVPVLTPRLSSLWLELITPVQAAVARPLVEGLRSPTVATDERLRTLVPFPLTPFEKAVLEALNENENRPAA